MEANTPWGDEFARRHIGPDNDDIEQMLAFLGAASLDELIDKAVPRAIRLNQPLANRPPLDERQLLALAQHLGGKNKLLRSYLGMGYADCITPPVIQRNILENPGWYTQYTPYQAEIAQGRLEALLNFQTAVIDLTGLEIANASLLDEGTAAAEAMAMLHALQSKKNRSNTFFAVAGCHPQTLEVLRTRAWARGWTLQVGPVEDLLQGPAVFGALLQYPATDGAVGNYRPVCEQIHQAGGQIVVAADILSLTVLTPPGEWGADVVVGSTQRLGMPMGYGGPHAAFFATRAEYRRQIPGRIIGVSQDRRGKPALRMALQTREQHIRREKATSNICTAQVLPAVVASMYAVYHGPQGLHRIGHQVHQLARQLAQQAEAAGLTVVHDQFFDTVCLRQPGKGAALVQKALAAEMNWRLLDADTLTIALDETTRPEDVAAMAAIFGGGGGEGQPSFELAPMHQRQSPYLTHQVFNRHRSETELLRYMNRLQARDLSLATSMIPLGSCTMKLNATAEMMPITWPKFAALHPFAPRDQAAGYGEIFTQLEDELRQMTGMAAVSLQPNAGAQGEYAGLLVIRQYHAEQGQDHRRICLIPASAHGTNPASAVMAGLEVVVVACDEQGNVDVDDLQSKAQKHADELAALMVTYPSTHGVFEERIGQICAIVHQCGGQVYMDGANMNALVGLCRPADLGVDVCHLNLHKTFCIPHGGGGPGMGPIAVGSHLAPYLPGHPQVATGGQQAIGPISAAPWGSAVILLISWAYLKLMGSQGLLQATKIAILNANYVARKLDDIYSVLYKGAQGLVAHEAILDLRGYKSTAGITVEDVAKRLMDYGFHAPTVSFPVPGTLMIEPTESEAKAELDRFCQAMRAIYHEISQIESGASPPDDNPLVGAPHTLDMITGDTWEHSYSRQQAVLPAPWLQEHKFWPAVARVDNAQGDRQLICACPPLEDYL